MEVVQWLFDTLSGELIGTMLISMVPVLELKGGIPFGVALGLPVWSAFLAAVIGNLIPVPFIVVYIRRIFSWMRARLPRLNGLVDRLEKKAHLRGEKMRKYEILGLIILVAIPVPGTGAWLGSLVAALLELPLRRAFPAIAVGILIAGGIVAALTHGFVRIF